LGANHSVKKSDNAMISALITLTLYIYARFNGHNFLALIFLPSIFFYSYAYEIKEGDLAQSYFEFARISDFSLYILFGVFLYLSCLLGLSRFTALRKKQYRLYMPEHSFISIRYGAAEILYYALAFASLLGFYINFSRVGFDFALMFLSPRDYEELFGESTAINYIYFLNVPAVCLSIYYNRVIGRKLKFSFIINLLLIASSVFHGIKFTVFDAILMPSIFLYHTSKNQKKALLLVISSIAILLFFYIGFSFFVRGANEDESPFASILNYILPNYYNFAYLIEKNQLIFDPLLLVLPDKIPSPLSGELFEGSSGFLLNDRFNVSTAFFAVYSGIPVISWLLFYPVIFYIRGLVASRTSALPSFFRIFLLVYIDYSLIFSWYFYSFMKTKYVFYLAVFAILSYVVMAKRRTVPIFSH
jgi:hypothetical protein